METEFTAYVAAVMTEEAIRNRTSDLSKGNRLHKKLVKLIKKAALNGKTSVAKDCFVFSDKEAYCVKKIFLDARFGVISSKMLPHLWVIEVSWDHI